MQITVRAHHVDITAALKDYAESKMGKLTKFFDNIQEIHIDMDIEDNSAQNQRQTARVTVHAAQARLHAVESSADMYASIDLVYKKLEPQLKKHKEKMSDHRGSKHPVRSLSPKIRSVRPHRDQENDTEKRYIAKPLSPEEAAEMLAVQQLDFLVFRNASTEEVNVIYPISSHEYGLIEP